MRLRRHEYMGPEERRRDLIIGFVGWWVVNILLTLVQGLVYSQLVRVQSEDSGVQTLVTLATGIAALVPWVVNIGGLIYFALTRSRIALGALAAFGVAALIVVCLGLLVAAACFVLTQQH